LIILLTDTIETFLFPNDIKHMAKGQDDGVDRFFWDVIRSFEEIKSKRKKCEKKS